MKTLSTVIAALVLSLFTAGLAHAQPSSGSSGPLPEVRVALPAELASCVAACTAPAASPRPADHTECPAAVDTATSTRIERLSREIHRIRTQVAANTASIADHERRIRSLEDQIGLLSRRVSDLERQAREEREAIAALQRDLATLRSDYERAIGELGRRVTDLETSFTALSRSVSTLETRVSGIESRMVSVRIGVRSGFLVLGSTDGTVYTGVPVLANLTLQFTPSTFASVSGGALFSGGSSPVGAYGRLGLGFDLHPNWALETGVSTAWVGYNSTLHASSMFLMGDVGPTFRYKWFSANASIMAGAEFDRSTAFAFGGIGTIRAEWP